MTKAVDRSPGLYVHIPFCISRCSYCAFVTGLYQPDLADRYLNSLRNELAYRNLFSEAGKPVTLFIGGGTPTSLSLRQMEKLFALLPFPESDGEATVEINPDSLCSEKLALLRQSGINRCSFGVQTFSRNGLHLLGRRHDAETAKKKIIAAVAAGFSSVSLDLISGWPGQSEEEFVVDLHQAVDLGVTHISCYNLIIEEESRFCGIMKDRGLAEKEETEMRRFWDRAESVLENHGFIHYETSNFSRPGFACRHNIDTWKGKEYLGIGSSAHSHLHGRRMANHSNPDSYIYMIEKNGMAEVFSEQLPPRKKAKECAAFWLRLFEGINCKEFLSRTGFDLFELYPEDLPKLISQGTIEVEKNALGGTMVRVKKEMHPLLDAILVDLV